jgi:GntR family transcriptional regulator
MIDLDSHIPYYIQVEEVIRTRIREGVWVPGDRLPSEAELCEMFDVSRTVVRQALQNLIHEGLIKRRKGKGSFVAERKITEQLAQKLTGFYQDMVEQGLQPETQVLKQVIVPASPEVAYHLKIEANTPVTEILRLRSVQQVAIMLVTTFVPYALCPNLVNENLTNQSLYALLENRYGVYIVRGRRIIQAVLAKEYEAKLLGVRPGAPLLRLDSTSYDRSGTPVEYYFAYHSGDRSQFEVELIRSRDPLELDQRAADLPRSNSLAHPR